MQKVKESIIQPLVPTVTSAELPSLHADPTLKDKNCCRVFFTCSKNHYVCLRSRTAFLILFWNIIVGIVYGSLQVAIIAGSIGLNMKTIKKVQIITAGLAGIAVIQILLFPLGGLLADIWQGRYRIIHFSFVKITIGLLLLSTCYALTIYHVNYPYALKVTLPLLCSVILSLGFAGFQSNAIQFGLEQLQDSSSQELSIFLHWYVWTSSMGEMIAKILGSLLTCNPYNKYLEYLTYFMAVLILILLFMAWYLRHSFHCEPKCDNPYGAVLKVLKFVAKHKYPLRRSAQTYCGDMTPTRMDYANIVFGGPFSVEVVEDVKTFLRMVAMMLMICPVFFYDVSVSSLFPLYGIHLGENTLQCKVEWIFLESGNTSHIVTCLLIPLYILFFFPKMTKHIPRILHRLILGNIMLVVAVVIMWLLYLTAITLKHETLETHHNETAPQCLFFQEINKDNGSLDFNTAYLLIPEILIGIAFPLVNISILEFVSAQSPYPMKGLLLGTFYALRGIFVLLGCSSIYIFTTKYFEHSSLFSDCGFIFYGVNICLGFVFLCVSMRAIKWYQYRKREEKPYDHRYVEDYYSRYASKVIDFTRDGSNESQHNYGTCQNPDGSFTINSE